MKLTQLITLVTLFAALNLSLKAQTNKSQAPSSKRAYGTIEKIGPVTEENVGKVIEELQKDALYRKKAEPMIKKSIYAFAEEAFELTPEQKKEMRRNVPPKLAMVIQENVLMAIEEGGAIHFDSARATDLKVTITYKTDPTNPSKTECDLTISSDP